MSMMTSSNGNIFRVTGPLCGEFTGPGEFPTQRPVTRSFDVFFDLRLNKPLSKQPWGWSFETPSWSLWRHRNGLSYFHNDNSFTSKTKLLARQFCRASENIFRLQCKRGSSKWASPHHKQFATFLRNFYIFKQLLGNFEIWASVQRTRCTLFSNALQFCYIEMLLFDKGCVQQKAEGCLIMALVSFKHAITWQNGAGVNPMIAHVLPIIAFLQGCQYLILVWCHKHALLKAVLISLVTNIYMHPKSLIYFIAQGKKPEKQSQTKKMC